MIYIKKITDIQEIYIPRTELDKEAYITSVKTYEDGYNEGLIDGKEQQKDKLLNLYVTKNGVYNRNDGYGIITVDIETEECPDCPECPPISLEKGNFTASENGEYVITPTEGFDGLESLNLRVDVPQEGGNCNLVGGTLKYPIGGDYNEFIATDYGYDGFEWLGVDATYHNEWMQAKHFYENNNSVKKNITITENGEYSLYGYNGLSLAAKNFVWFTNVIPTIETDVEIWVIPYRYYNVWEGFIGSQNEDDDNSTFQIRRNGYENVFEFRFGEQIHSYEMKNPNQWYKLRMNRYGVWVNDEQIRSWEVNEFQDNNYPLAINGIYNPQWDNFTDFYRSAAGQYGYVYFHNLDLLYAPISSGYFVNNNNDFSQYARNENSLLKPFQQSREMNYNNITISVEGDECNCDDAYNEGYNNGYNDGQANCGEGGGCVLEHLEVGENGYYEPQGEVYDYLIVRENSAFDTGVKLVENTTIEIFFNTGDYDGNIPTLIGCEDADLNNTTFAVRWFGGNLAIKIGTQEINIPMGAEDEATKFHKLKFGKSEGVWFDEQYLGSLEGGDWQMSQNTIYIGAMHNHTNGDENGVWRPWNGYLGNVRIYGEKNGEVRDFTFLCGDYGRWGEYMNEGEVLPNLMGDGGAILNCCKQYGDKPFDGYRSVSVNIDVEPYKEEGRNEIRNNLKSINITENGNYNIYDGGDVNYLNFGVDNNVWFSTNKNITKDSEIELAFMCANENHSENTLIATANGFKVTFSGGGLRGIIGDKNTWNVGYNAEAFAVNYVKVNKEGITCNENFVDWSGNDWGENIWDYLTDSELFIGTDTYNSEYNFKNGLLWVKIDGVEFKPIADNSMAADNGDTLVNGGDGMAWLYSAWVNKYDGSGWREINVDVKVQSNPQEDMLAYDALAIEFEGNGWAYWGLNQDNILNSNYESADCVLTRIRSGKGWVFTKQDKDSGILYTLKDGWFEYKYANEISKLTLHRVLNLEENSLICPMLKEIDLGYSSVKTNAINAPKLSTIRIDYSGSPFGGWLYEGCFVNLPQTGTITIKLSSGINIEPTISNVRDFISTRVPEGWTIIIE